MNANTTTQVTLGKGKAVHAGTRTDENGVYNPQPVCPAAKAGQYVETGAEVTCKRCLKALADEAAREAAHQDRVAASMEPVTEAHDLGYVHADEPATVADEQPAEVREIREAAEADADLARRTEDAFRALIADMGPYDDIDDDVYEPDEDELNDPLIQRGALAVATDMTGYTFRDGELPEVTVTVVDDRRGLIQGPGGRVGELLSVHDGFWSATDENHKFVILDAASRDLAARAWAVLMGFGQVVVRNASPDVVSVVLDDETKGRVSFNGNTGRIEYTGAWWCVRDENGAVVGPLRTTETAAAMAWAHHLGAEPGINPVKVTVGGAA